MLLFHGTTMTRARNIIRHGPNVNFVEPGGGPRAENFSACLPFGPFGTTGRLESYACLKVAAAKREGRDEGCPAILIVDVPDPIVDEAVSDLFPLSQGFVQFDPETGLGALLAAWLTLPKRIIPFDGESR